MSTGNAFATAAHDGVPGSGQEDSHDGPRASKRQRVSEIASAAMWLPSARSETSLEVDVMILDFFAFQATKACLESRRLHENGPNIVPGSLRSSLELVDSFTLIFKARHPHYHPDAELRFRLLLLKMSTLFTQRFTLNPTTPDRSSLEALRIANRERAEAWIGGSFGRAPSANPCVDSQIIDTIPVAPDSLERNRAHVLHQLGVPAEDEDYEDAFYGTPSCVSLLDLLPSFIELSAASSSIHGSSLTPRWMRLACEFMLQAWLEQHLVYGAEGLDPMDEAFAWGYAKLEDVSQTTTSTKRRAEINDMFEDDTYATEVGGWAELRWEHVRELTTLDWEQDEFGEREGLPDVVSHLERVATLHPIDAFEASILKFLEALSTSIAEPVLVQLEHGRLDGMTEEQTNEFLTQCGVEL